MNIDKIIVRHSALTNGIVGLLISLITCSETAVPIRIGSISLYFPDCMFGEDRSQLTIWYETTPVRTLDAARTYLVWTWPKLMFINDYDYMLFSTDGDDVMVRWEINQ